MLRQHFKKIKTYNKTKSDCSISNLSHRSQSTKCCPDIGCYDTQPPFDWLPLPDCPEEFTTSIHMYTRHNPEVGHVIDRTVIP